MSVLINCGLLSLKVFGWMFVLHLFIAQSFAACARKDVGYLIGSNNFSWVSKDTLEEIRGCAGIVVLDVPSGNSDRGLVTLTESLHNSRPELPVLNYTWLTRLVDTPRAGSKVLSGAMRFTDWLIKTKTGIPLARGRKTNYFPDLGNPEFRSWAVDRIATWVDETGAGGVFLDMLFLEPSGPLNKWCKDDTARCVRYSNGLKDALLMLGKRMPGKLLIGNGIFSDGAVSLEKQAELIPFLHGMAIEYFGLVPRKGVGSFAIDILPYLRLIEDHPNELFLVYGREPWNPPENFNFKKWRRFLYVAYLLVSRDNVYFKYHASFQVPSHTKGVDGLFLIRDQLSDNNIGSPLRPYQHHGGLYWRRFTHGLVALCSQDMQVPCSLNMMKLGNLDKDKTVNAPRVLIPGDAIIVTLRH